MNITIATSTLLQTPSDLAVLLLPEGATLPAEVAALLEPADFTGKAKQQQLLYPRGALATKRLLLLGLGKPEALDAEALRQAAATAVRQAQMLQVTNFSLGLHGAAPLPAHSLGQVLAEGLELGAYRYHRYRTGLTPDQQFVVEHAVIVAESEPEAVTAGVAVGQVVARGVCLARDLVNTPGGALPPSALAATAVALGQRTQLKVTVFDKPQLVEQGFGGLLAVGQGSANEPYFIVIEHGTPAEDKPTLCLVGKGLTFDSGGLSLKPADSMTTMKMDMGGSAAVLGAMQVLSELELPLHVVGLIPTAENMPSATAYRPDDVLTTLSGKTIEVLNTDAEGRIVLADALFYAQRYNPAAIVELSTLTGAIVVALGPHATGMMATDQALADQIKQAGEVSGERVWQLPLWDEYREMIKSEIADIKNTGGRQGGSITAAAFLAHFVGDYPFVHLDIAGTAFNEKPTKAYQSVGATGVGVRLLAQFLRSYGS
ncbi:leucyl aminopeptidase [Candidatus Viridilinea mediisalina]|uniref:Probable cytosol aminopeptidase n=1 Tax=Candidatus Viridilinea mediisalina TaxID=2024553 RepID=A0A2A6RKB2_9CHLR|nr:leucyl aminopeptidase [Candidatus Viridilinea mediisalina]PDW03326.1 leucyl aminopeptidase [Candidatus Viridilinea mediisalina]